MGDWEAVACFIENVRKPQLRQEREKDDVGATERSDLFTQKDGETI